MKTKDQSQTVLPKGTPQANQYPYAQGGNVFHPEEGVLQGAPLACTAQPSCNEEYYELSPRSCSDHYGYGSSIPSLSAQLSNCYACVLKRDIINVLISEARCSSGYQVRHYSPTDFRCFNERLWGSFSSCSQQNNCVSQSGEARLKCEQNCTNQLSVPSDLCPAGYRVMRYDGISHEYICSKDIGRSACRQCGSSSESTNREDGAVLCITPRSGQPSW